MEYQIRQDNSFFLIYSLILLGIVIVGFSPSLFLRFAFDTPPIPLYLHAHGVILTGWFILLVTQASLIRAQCPLLHRKLGYFAAAYGLLVVIGGLTATLNVVSRELGLGITLDMDMAEIDSALGSGITYLVFISGVVWGNIVAVSIFAVLLCAAIFFRRRPDIHKRLVLVATVSLLEPALARISRIEILGGEQGLFVPTAFMTLLLAIIIYDVVTLGKPHPASLMASVFAIVMGTLGSIVAASQFGLAFTRNLA